MPLNFYGEQPSMKNLICTDKKAKGRPKVDRPKRVQWRPKTQAARDKFLEIGGSRWLDRIMEGLTS